MHFGKSRRAARLAALGFVIFLVGCGGVVNDSAQMPRSSPSKESGGPITITFMRHAESAGNASGLIDTSTPGPDITDKGRRQAQAAAYAFSTHGYDGVFASTVVRTQQTAEYMSKAVGKDIEILPGLREVEAGQYEGQPEKTSEGAYLSAPIAWIGGNRSERIPGSIDGNEFDHRFDEAIDQIYKTGHVNPIVFAHGVSIQSWVLMNVKNPDSSVLENNLLQNTGYIVITGSPEMGWTLLDWNGTRFPQT